MLDITTAQLKRIAPNGRADILDAISKGEAILDRYQINTPNRLAHFLAQAAHESAGFKTTKEYWGPTAAQKRYEGRKDLGNSKPGDGKRFMGRGIFQLTGRANYRVYGKKLGIDLEENPERAADPATSLLIACEYWQSRNINQLADQNDIVAITKKINGGTNGLEDRKAYLAKAKAVFSSTAQVAKLQPKTNVDVKDLQEDLIALGYSIEADGEIGPKTRAAIRGVQERAGITVDGIAGPATRSAIDRLLTTRAMTGEPPAKVGAMDAFKTPEGIATAATAAAPILNAAANPGPFSTALAVVVVIAAVIAAYFIIKRLRKQEDTAT